MVGKQQVGGDRFAFSIDCALPDGRRIFENTTVYTENGTVTREVAVEARDQ